MRSTETIHQTRYRNGDCWRILDSASFLSHHSPRAPLPTSSLYDIRFVHRSNHTDSSCPRGHPSQRAVVRCVLLHALVPSGPSKTTTHSVPVCATTDSHGGIVSGSSPISSAPRNPLDAAQLLLPRRSQPTRYVLVVEPPDQGLERTHAHSRALSRSGLCSSRGNATH